jgi:hypothetical protein
MTRKQTTNAPRLLQAAEAYLFALELNVPRSVETMRLNELKKAVEASREPLRIVQGLEIPFAEQIH